LALWGLSEALKNDKEIALAAVQQNNSALEYVSQELLSQYSDIFGSVGPSQSPSSLWFKSGENRGLDSSPFNGEINCRP
jgi:hypothetical protein